MIIKKAHVNDLKAIMSMYSSCVKGMIENNIDQWDETYPNSNVIKEDIKAGTYFVAIINKEIIGGINIDQKQDKTYLTIKWLNNTNLFLVVHRLAVKKEYWQKKIGKKLMSFAEELAKKKKFNSVRLDTYSGNPKAMLFYKKLGYRLLGDINLKPGKNEYYCFEKIL